MTQEETSSSCWKTSTGKRVYVLFTTQKDGWLVLRQKPLEDAAAAGGEVVISATDETSGRFGLWIIPAADLTAVIRRAGVAPSLDKGQAYSLHLQTDETTDIIRQLDWDIRPYRRESGQTELKRATFWPTGSVPKPEKTSHDTITQGNEPVLAHPFNEMFVDWEEAEWFFGLLAKAAQHLGIEGPDDPMAAWTLRRQDSRQYRLHFSYGLWLVLGLEGKRGNLILKLALFRDRLALRTRRVEPFKQREGEKPISLHYLEARVWRQLTEDEQAVYWETLDYIKQLYTHWQASPYHRHTDLSVARAVFDSDVRAQLLSQGISNLESADDLKAVATGSEEDEQPQRSVQPTYPLPQFAADTGFPVEELARWVRAIERKGQVILYGPPGTGKTFVAERLARHLIGGGDGFMELVQFHPAYAYEDFIQGIRPKTTAGGGLSYPTEPGRFLEFCAEAEKRQGTCVLIIDEINRANLARVFGELMYLLEYRNREVPLAGGGRLRIPSNVRLIGTMNTADRSIALVDHALRRRFAFLALYPQFDVLRKYHQHHDPGYPVEKLIQVLHRLNNAIYDRHYHVGITYFLRPRLATEIEDIWRMEIEPYLEEYFFDQPEKADAFRWEQVKHELLSS